ncbi:MAG: hypothetical protein HZA16_10065 [Nitrospirae bacterium]|nr:hypothetical protein [Nitrospirota bacterium]
MKLVPNSELRTPYSKLGISVMSVPCCCGRFEVDHLHLAAAEIMLR